MSVADKLLQLNQVKQNIKDAIVDKGVEMDNVPFTEYHTKILEISGSGNGGGGITKKTVNIPFTEVVSETMTNIEVTYSYVGDDPINFTADFSNFTLGDSLVLDIGSGPVPPSMAVQAIFGKTILNYFEIIILFRYIISATLVGGMVGKGITRSSSTQKYILMLYDEDYRNPLPIVFEGISDVNINGATFTVDFMTQCQDINFYNTVTGRGSDMSVTVETIGEIIDFLPIIFLGVTDQYFYSVWNELLQSNDLSASTLSFSQYIGGMTLKLFPNIKMKVNYNGANFVD